MPNQSGDPPDHSTTNSVFLRVLCDLLFKTHLEQKVAKAAKRDEVSGIVTTADPFILSCDNVRSESKRELAISRGA